MAKTCNVHEKEEKGVKIRSNELVGTKLKEFTQEVRFHRNKKEERRWHRTGVLYPLSSGLYAREFRFVTHVNVMFVLL